MAKNAQAKTFLNTLEADGWYRTLPPVDITAPTLPTITGISVLGQTSVTVNWTASSDTQTGVKDYEVRYKPASDSNYISAGITTSLSMTIAGLLAGTAYHFSVRVRDNAPTPNVSSWTANTTATTDAPPASGVEPYPWDGAYLQGTATFPLTSDEITNRGYLRLIVWTGPERGYDLTEFQAGIDAVKAAAEANGHTIEQFLYTNTSEYQIARPTAVNNRAVWDKIDNENWWLRVSYPAGAQILLGAKTYQCNPALGHTEAVASYGSQKLYWTEWYPYNSLVTLGMNNIAGVFCDNMRFDPFSGGGDLNEGAAGSPSGAEARGLIIDAMYRKTNFVNSLGKKTIFNGAQDWWIRYSKDSVDERARMQGVCDGCVLELFADNGPQAINTRWSIYHYVSSMGTLPTANHRNWPANTTASATPATGTLLRNTFGGWEKNTAGTNIYQSGSNQSIRAMYEWLLSSGIYKDPKYVIIQTQGPAPNRFGVWSSADSVARAMYMHVYAATPWRSHYTMWEQTNSRAVASYLDEQKIRWGDPVSGELGKPGLMANHGSGIGNGYASGVHVRKFYDSVSGKHRLVVWNPLGNGDKTISLPAGNWRKFGSSDIGGSTPQSSYNNGANVSSSFLIEDCNAALLLEQ